MTKTISLLQFLIVGFFLLIALPTQAFTTTENLTAGDLIRGESYSAVYYYGEDGFRYVFPNDKTYFTWYDNFDDVVWLTDGDLADIQIGGNVTYKPGVKMVKITSDPKVYVVGSGGELRAIPSETVAEALYGSSWNTMIDDVPDGFFSNYTLGSALEFASQFDPSSEEASAWGIGSDKSLKAYTLVTITDAGYSSVSIKAGTVVRFYNAGSDKHTASADDGSWGTGTLNTGDHFSRYFNEDDELNFHDAYDSSLSGSITLE
jgi:plastocyanin